MMRTKVPSIIRLRATKIDSRPRAKLAGARIRCPQSDETVL